MPHIAMESTQSDGYEMEANKMEKVIQRTRTTNFGQMIVKHINIIHSMPLAYVHQAQ